jgi:hypothetical protein
MSPVKVRASSLSELFDCPARWESKHIQGRRQPGNHKSLLGKAVHASTAVYDQGRLDGNQVSIDDAAGAAVDAIHKSEEDTIWEDIKPQTVEDIALSLHKKYCESIAPKQNYKAVEVQCESLLIEDIGIILTGTTDRLYENDFGYGIADIKTGGGAVDCRGQVNIKGHSYQLGVYELLAEMASGIPITEPAQIIGLNTGKTEVAQRVGVGMIAGARDVLIGDESTPGILKTASEMIHKGVFYGNPKSMMCSQVYCPIYNSCSYRK